MANRREGRAASGFAQRAKSAKAAHELGAQTADDRLRRRRRHRPGRGRRDRRRRPAGGGGDEGGGDSHINLESGSTNGVQLDDRAGTKPPAVKVANLKQAAKEAGCELRLSLKDEGHEHIPPGRATPEYKTNPPTSGNHVEPPYQQADGAYSEMPRRIDIVHSLEHGRMEIQYAPTCPKRTSWR